MGVTDTRYLVDIIVQLEQNVADLQRRVYQLEQLEHRIDDGK